MNLLDLVVGRPIKTSDERAEQIGPAQGIPIFGLDALSSAAYGPEAALSLLIPLGLDWRSIYRSDHRGHRDTTGDRIFFLSSDDRGLPSWRRLLYRGALQSGSIGEPACRGSAPGRLYPHRGRRNLRWRRRADFGRPFAAAVYGLVVHRDPDRRHHPESSWSARCGNGFRDSDLFLLRALCSPPSRRESFASS